MNMVPVGSDITQESGARILLLDEDGASRHDMTTYFDGYGMRVTAAPGVRDFLHTLSARAPDLVIIRVGAEHGSGLHLVREIRDRSAAPLFVVNRRDRDDDRIAALERGADDYLIEPFSLRELLARVRATLRRRGLDRLAPARKSERCYAFGGWLFDLGTRALHHPSGEPVLLTKSEFALLAAFVKAPRCTWSREDLLRETRLHDDVFDRSIDVQVFRLRRKLAIGSGQPQVIRTIRGIGYRFDTDPKIVTTHQPRDRDRA